LAYIDHVNLLGDNINTIDISKDVGLRINAEKTKFITSHHQNSRQNHDVNVSNRSFENVAQLKSFGTTVRTQNFIREENERRLNSGNNTSSKLIQKILSSILLYRNVTIRLYKPTVLPLVQYGCETLPLTLREECRLRVFEDRSLRRILGPKRDEVTGGWRKLRNEELHNLYSSPSVIGMIKLRMIIKARG
jgi:hypothetical protein